MVTIKHNVLIFEKGMSDYRMKLTEELQEIVSGDQVAVSTTVESLRSMLQTPCSDSFAVLILIVSGKQDLEDLNDIILDHSFYNSSMRTILILPARGVGLEEIGHKLRPRFIDYQDSDPAETKIVLANILEGSQRKSILKEVSYGK